VYQAVEEMSRNFPEGLKYTVRYDTMIFVRETVSESL
jgi:multidrug efflux pump subunit AcrB